jgi:hypothetical protein
MDKETENISREQFDERTIYCRMLGHELTFKYCRSTADDRFCPRVFDCWHEKIDVAGYIGTFFTKDEILAIIHPPASKMETLINLIQKSGATG